MCTCIYCVLWCLYCVFVLFRLCIFILICFVCTSVRTTATEWQLNCSTNNDNDDNNNNIAWTDNIEPTKNATDGADDARGFSLRCLPFFSYLQPSLTYREQAQSSGRQVKLLSSDSAPEVIASGCAQQQAIVCTPFAPADRTFARLLPTIKQHIISRCTLRLIALGLARIVCSLEAVLEHSLEREE
jgi:hypothetical protein